LVITNFKRAENFLVVQTNQPKKHFKKSAGVVDAVNGAIKIQEEIKRSNTDTPLKADERNFALMSIWVM
jgi:hypothetical protein